MNRNLRVRMPTLQKLRHTHTNTQAYAFNGQRQEYDIEIAGGEESEIEEDKERRSVKWKTETWSHLECILYPLFIVSQ